MKIKNIINASNGEWMFERSSGYAGYAGYRCQKCGTWRYANKELICDCKKEKNK